MIDYYLILGIEENSSQEEIKRAYRRMSSRYHPDKNRGTINEAEERMKLVNEAYSILSDLHKRKNYDEMRSQSKGVNLDDENKNPNGYKNEDSNVNKKVVKFNINKTIFALIIGIGLLKAIIAYNKINDLGYSQPVQSVEKTVQQQKEKKENKTTNPKGFRVAISEDINYEILSYMDEKNIIQFSTHSGEILVKYDENHMGWIFKKNDDVVDEISKLSALHKITKNSKDEDYIFEGWCGGNSCYSEYIHIDVKNGIINRLNFISDIEIKKYNNTKNNDVGWVVYGAYDVDNSGSKLYKNLLYYKNKNFKPNWIDVNLLDDDLFGYVGLESADFYRSNSGMSKIRSILDVDKLDILQSIVSNNDKVYVYDGYLFVIPGCTNSFCNGSFAITLINGYTKNAMVLMKTGNKLYYRHNIDARNEHFLSYLSFQKVINNEFENKGIKIAIDNEFNIKLE